MAGEGLALQLGNDSESLFIFFSADDHHEFELFTELLLGELNGQLKKEAPGRVTEG